MAMVYEQKTITSTAGSILSSADSRRRLILKNTGTVPVYFGESGSVTTGIGFPIPVGQTFYLNDYKGPVYCIVSSTSGKLSVVEERI